MAEKAGLKGWSVTADDTAVNLRTFEILSCSFNDSYDEITTSIIHPTTGEEVSIIPATCLNLLVMLWHTLGPLLMVMEMR